MPTIANMIANRLHEIEEQFQVEVSAPQPRAQGGPVHDPLPGALARARAREGQLWNAIGADQIPVWTPKGPKRLTAITDFVSDMRAKIRQEQNPRELRKLMETTTRFENLIKIEASRASDREARAS